MATESLPLIVSTEIERRPHRELAQSVEGREVLAERARAKARAPYSRVQGRTYETRPFIAWDGEGANDDYNRHQYILFGNSRGDEISGDSLGTAQCLDLLWTAERDNPDSYHVIFSGKYDVNMILKDCHYMVLDKLHSTGRARWGGYRLAYAPGKYFRVTRGTVTCTLFDVWAFFGTSFVVACREYLGNDPILDRMELMKSKRNEFTAEDLPAIREYFREELLYLVKLMQKLRQNLMAAKLPISSWHGPGAIASLMMRNNGVKGHKQETPVNVIEVVQHAYAGGRPEALCGGMYLGTVYQYDRNSAYPAEIAQLPSLARSTWSYHKRAPQEIDDYGIYHITGRSRFDATLDAIAHPLFWRGNRGEVYYPPNVNGWYWGSEARLLYEYQCYDDWSISEYYVLHPANDRKPFAYVADMYEQRRQWKSEGNPANVAYKLGLNSSYGKLAQRVTSGKGGPPAWHQLEWAGIITAANRASMFRAMRQQPHSVIAVATDAVFSTEPLDLPISGILGDWEYTESTGIIQLQSGVYWLRNQAGDWKAKYRGFNKGSLTLDMAVEYLAKLDNDPTAELSAPSTRFMTWSQTRGSSKWRQWFTEPRTLQFGSPLSKRGHYQQACPECIDGTSLTDTLHTFHSCGLPWIGRSMSSPHSLPWSDYGDDSNYPEGDILL
jgi:hypothetical protein